MESEFQSIRSTFLQHLILICYGQGASTVAEPVNVSVYGVKSAIDVRILESVLGDMDRMGKTGSVLLMADRWSSLH